MSRPLPECLALLCAAAGAAAQESRPVWQEILAQLRSHQPAEQAWGAWHAVQGRHVQAGPELVRILNQLADGDDTGDGEFVLRAVLDAVVQLEPRIPPEALAPWLRKDRLQTAALLCALRSPRDYATQLLALLDGPLHDTTWVPVTGALLDGDARSVVPHLVAAARTRVEVLVQDGKGTVLRGGSMSSQGCGTIQAPPGFPPTVLYLLEFTNRGGSTAVLQEPTPVWYRREAHAEQTFGVGGSTPQLDRADHALACLHRLAGLPPALRLPSRRKITVAWSGSESYLADVARELEPLRNRWQETLRSLVGRKLLASDQLAKLPAPLEFDVRDLRRDRRTPLPELPR